MGGHGSCQRCGVPLSWGEAEGGPVCDACRAILDDQGTTDAEWERLEGLQHKAWEESQAMGREATEGHGNCKICKAILTKVEAQDGMVCDKCQAEIDDDIDNRRMGEMEDGITQED